MCVCARTYASCAPKNISVSLMEHRDVSLGSAERALESPRPPRPRIYHMADCINMLYTRYMYDIYVIIKSTFI